MSKFFFIDKDPIFKARQTDETKSAKFIKSYSFFDSTPAPYVTAYVRIPQNPGFVTSKEDLEPEKISASLSDQDIIVKLSNPPYNIIKSFQYDVIEGKIDAEFIDGNGALTDLIIKQFSDINNAIGTMTIVFRFGWSTPTFPIRAELIEDLANPRPAKTIQGTNTLKPRIRFSQYITAIITDMEMEVTSSGISYKIEGSNKITTRIIPEMEYFTPYRFLGSYPLIEFGAFDKLDILLKKLQNNEKQETSQNKDNIIYETTQEWMNELGVKNIKFIPILTEVIQQVKNLKEIKDKEISSNPYGATAQDINKFFKTESVANILTQDLATGAERIIQIKKFYLIMLEIINREVGKVTNQNKKLQDFLAPNEILTSILLNSEGGTVDAFDALKYILKTIQFHMYKLLSTNGTSKIVIPIPLIFLSKNEMAQKPSAEKKDGSAQGKGIDPQKIWNQIPIRNLMIDPTTKYETLLKDITSYMRIFKEVIKNKDKSGKNIVESVIEKDVDFNYFVAYGRDDILAKLIALRVNIEILSDKGTVNIDSIVNNIKSNLGIGYDNNKNPFTAIVKKIEAKGLQFMEKLILEIKNDRTNSFENCVVVFYVFSEYSNSNFFETLSSQNIINGYNYIPGGFQTIMENSSGLKTGLRNTTIDTNYFNTGTLNYEKNNFPDVISFSPKISYQKIRMALAQIVKKGFADNSSYLFLEQKQQEEEEALKKESNKGKTPADIKAELELKRKEEINRIKKLSEIAEKFSIDEKFKTVSPNGNVVVDNSSYDAMLLRLNLENFRKNLSSLLIGFEAEMKIIGEPFYDTLQINKVLNVQVYSATGNPTMFSGTYRISGISHEVQGGKFETTLKLFRENIDVDSDEEQKRIEIIGELSTTGVISKNNNSNKNVTVETTAKNTTTVKSQSANDPNKYEKKAKSATKFLSEAGVDENFAGLVTAAGVVADGVVWLWNKAKEHKQQGTLGQPTKKSYLDNKTAGNTQITN